MKAYGIDYKVKGRPYSTIIDAKDVKSAKQKIGRKHGYKSGRAVTLTRVTVIGYF